MQNAVGGCLKDVFGKMRCSWGGVSKFPYPFPRHVTFFRPWKGVILTSIFPQQMLCRGKVNFPLFCGKAISKKYFRGGQS